MAIEVDKNNLEAVFNILLKHNIYHKEIGKTTNHQAMVFGEKIHMAISKAKEGWEKSLRSKINK
mgnify:FL=1